MCDDNMDHHWIENEKMSSPFSRNMGIIEAHQENVIFFDKSTANDEDHGELEDKD